MQKKSGFTIADTLVREWLEREYTDEELLTITARNLRALLIEAAAQARG